MKEEASQRAVAGMIAIMRGLDVTADHGSGASAEDASGFWIRATCRS
jgi:hypothetical protein